MVKLLHGLNILKNVDDLLKLSVQVKQLQMKKLLKPYSSSISHIKHVSGLESRLCENEGTTNHREGSAVSCESVCCIDVFA